MTRLTYISSDGVKNDGGSRDLGGGSSVMDLLPYVVDLMLEVADLNLKDDGSRIRGDPAYFNPWPYMLYCIVAWCV